MWFEYEKAIRFTDNLYVQWLNDVYSSEISQRCEDVLNRLSETYGCQVRVSPRLL